MLKNYIEESTINSGKVVLDTDKFLNTIGVTGAVAAAVNGVSVGVSVYALGAEHTIETFIKNSNPDFSPLYK